MSEIDDKKGYMIRCSTSILNICIFMEKIEEALMLMMLLKDVDEDNTRLRLFDFDPKDLNNVDFRLLVESD